MELVKNRTQLINEAASKLRIRATGQALDAEDKSVIDDKIDPLFLQLASERICDIANDDAIPSEWFDPLAELLANRCSEYRKTDPGIDLYQKSVLKKLVSGSPSYETLPLEFF